MWCTRWFLPLLLLPLPTAPPYFLLLFLFSLTMHAKPCFYCIVLLTTLFVSSCYWQPFPLDSPLSSPWAENITTFAEALNATIMPNYSKPLPDVMRTVDRCWCDFSTGNFFEPFNVSHWEHVSIQRLKNDLENQQRDEEAVVRAQKTENTSVSTPTSQMPRTAAPAPSTTTHSKNTNMGTTNYRALFYPFSRRNVTVSRRISPSAETSVIQQSSSPKPETKISGPRSNANLPLIRKEYDLRPYGVGILIDFSWTR